MEKKRLIYGQGPAFVFYPDDEFFKETGDLFKSNGKPIYSKEIPYPGKTIWEILQKIYKHFVEGKKADVVNSNKDKIKKSLSFKNPENRVLWQPINQALMARRFWYYGMSHGAFNSLSQVPEISTPARGDSFSSGFYHWGGYGGSGATSGFIFGTYYNTARDVLREDLKIDDAEARKRIENAIRGQNRRICRRRKT